MNFIVKLILLFSDFVPVYKNVNKNVIYPAWFNVDIKADLRLKERHRMKYSRSKSAYHLAQYLYLRKTIKKNIEKARDDFIKSSEQDLNTQPSLFWTFIKKLRGEGKTPQVFNINNSSTIGANVIADGFADHFGSVFLPASDRPSKADNFVCCDRLGTVELPSTDDIMMAISKLPEKWSAGIDGIPCCVVKSLAGAFAEPLSIIFTACLRQGKYPKCWKIAKICPMHKAVIVH